MKKPIYDRDIISYRIRQRRWEVSVIRNRRKIPGAGVIIRGGKRLHKIDIPQQLDFSDNQEQTLKFFSDFRVIALSEPKLVILNFSKLEGISPAASIVLLAEIYRCWKLRKKKVYSSPIRKCKIARILQDTGFYQLLEAPHAEIKDDLPPEDASKVYIEFATAVQDDGRLADKIRKAVLEECPDTFPKECRDKIYRGLLECMSNVSRHAYEDKYKNHIPYPFNDRRWWVSGYVDKTKGEVLIQFYDQGAGIPNTLLTRLGEQITQSLGALLNEHPNATVIQQATEMGQSGTKKPYRGKGLPEIVDVIKTTKQGRLRIISHKGEYKIYNKNGITEPILNDNSISLDGTLIQWKVSARDGI